MKRIYSIISLCLLLSLAAGVVGAQSSALGGENTTSSPVVQPDEPEEPTTYFLTLKQRTLTRLSQCIDAIVEIKGKVQDNPKLNDTTKQIVIEALAQLENGFVEYKSTVEGTQNIGELRAARVGILKYLWENRTVIFESIKKVLVALGEEAQEKAEELKIKIETVLKVLKITCPSERETIVALEGQLAQMEIEIQLLKQAIAAQDIDTIRQQIKALGELGQDIAANIEKIQHCLEI